METLSSTLTPVIPLGDNNSNNVTTTTGVGPNNKDEKPSPIQAYAKLESNEYCYYIRTLQVTMGRRVARSGTVDIPLGNAKSVSRHHARLFYNFATQRFEMMVFGKNGAFINEQFVEKGVTVPLENRTKIQIGDASLLFLLPRMNLGSASPPTSPSVKDTSNENHISTPRQIEKHGGSSQRSRSSSTSSATTTAATAVTTPTTTEGATAGGMASDGDDEAYTTNKDIKPPFSYASLIAQAINSTEDKRMALHEIYNYITTHYPYYQMALNGWQNSIRHNLSLNKAFVKVPRGDAEPGKGAFWTIDPKAEIQFMAQTVNKRNTKRPSVTKGSSPGVESSSSRKRIKKETSDIEDDDLSLVTSPESKDASLARTTEPALSPPTPSGSSFTSAATLASGPTSTTAAASAVAMASSSGPVPPCVPAADHPPSVSLSQQQQQQQQQQEQHKQQPQQQSIQAQVQMQLQTTIRQHLLDPLRNPLPPSIAQLLPQAIAQLPPHLASQFSATFQSALRAHQSNQENNHSNTTTAAEPVSSSSPLSSSSASANKPSLLTKSTASTSPSS